MANEWSMKSPLKKVTAYAASKFNLDLFMYYRNLLLHFFFSLNVFRSEARIGGSTFLLLDAHF